MSEVARAPVARKGRGGSNPGGSKPRLRLLICHRVQMNSDSAQESNSEGPIKLTPGQSVTVNIEAKRRNNRTNVCFESEAVYDLSATGKWRDAGREVGPEGYAKGNFLQNLLRWLRRSPDCNWLALLGVAQTGQRAFLIGAQATHEARQAGELICFANDLPGSYWNNTDAVKLTITRIL
jgi:hypothetical protein